VTRIYVSNLPYRVTEAELTDCFGHYGDVEKVSLIRNRVTGESRGFAFVEMANDHEAAAAIADLNGKDFDGRRIRVEQARSRTAAHQHARNPRTGEAPGGLRATLAPAYLGTRLGEAGADAFTIMRCHSNVTVSQGYLHPSLEAIDLAYKRLTGVNLQKVGAAESTCRVAKRFPLRWIHISA
jgi:RNA recognition motif-containing protein